MKNILHYIVVTVIALTFFPEVNFGQAPNLGTAADFVLFTTNGAVTNTGWSHLTGHVGTNVGGSTGFGNVDGVMHDQDPASAQAKLDLDAAYLELDAAVATFFPGNLFGNGQTLNAGVYNVPAASTMNGNLNLDGQGDPNAVFIIQIEGTFGVNANASVNLLNSAQACNVFWKVDGAISVAAGATVRGTFVAFNSAIALNSGVTLEGRALATNGGIGIDVLFAYTPLGCLAPILTGPGNPDLLSTECFALFTAIGAVDDAGSATTVTGDVGSNSTSPTGFNPLLVTGTIHGAPDGATAQCATDFTTVYNNLSALPYDIELLYPAQFGNDLVLTPHVYLINGAVTFTDSIYLNAQGNEDAVFVFQVYGAFGTSTYSKVKLINGAKSKNVYWMINGAIDINEYSVFNGTIISQGAINLTAGAFLYGRALTGVGAISASASNVIMQTSCSIPLPVELLSFTGYCDKQNIILQWSTATEINNDYFTIERSTNGTTWQIVGTVSGSGNSSSQLNYMLTDIDPIEETSYYRLKQTDFDGKYKYSTIIYINKCEVNRVNQLTIYPNPSAGKVELLFEGNTDEINSIDIFNSQGQKVYSSIGFQSTFDLSNNVSGLYFMRVQQNSKSISLNLILDN